MNKLTPSQAAFGLCRRLDENYLNSVLLNPDYEQVESGDSGKEGSMGPSVPLIGAESVSLVPLELFKPMRSSNFHSLHRLLSFPLTEMISTAPPDLSSMGCHGEAIGFMVMYGAAGDYLDDKMEWQPQEKLSLKLIVLDGKTNRYKLRNSKNDEGEPVMRRHRRISHNKLLGWQRHEYKLFTDETVHRHNVDGTRTTITRRTLNPWPILVHYFRPPLSPSQRSSLSSSSIPSSSLASSSIAPNTSNNLIQTPQTAFRNNDPLDDGSEYHRVTKRAKTGLYSSRDTLQVNESDSDTGSIASSNTSLSRALRSLQTPLFSGDLAPIVNTRPPSTISHRSLTDETSPGLGMDESLNLRISDGFSSKLTHGNEMDGIEVSELYGMDVKMEVQGGLREWVEHSAENMAQAEEACIFISHYAPDASHCDEECPVLIVLGPDTIPCVKLSCFVDGIECDSEMVALNVIRVIIPKHDSGVVPLWLIGKDEMGNVLSHSESVPFYFLPTSSTEGVLNFAHALSVDYFTTEVFFKFRHTTRRLDLTGNGLTNIDFLRNFTELREVVLDHNQISHWVPFPHLPKLSSLSINHNSILQIDLFINRLIEAGLSNKLKYLSVLGNTANPSFDRLEHRYYNFRIYIISKLPKLKLLDSRDVTEAERRHSQAIAEEEGKDIHSLHSQHIQYQSTIPFKGINQIQHPSNTISDSSLLSSTISHFHSSSSLQTHLHIDQKDTLPFSINGNIPLKDSISLSKELSFSRELLPPDASSPFQTSFPNETSSGPSSSIGSSTIQTPDSPPIIILPSEADDDFLSSSIIPIRSPSGGSII